MEIYRYDIERFTQLGGTEENLEGVGNGVFSGRAAAGYSENFQIFGESDGQTRRLLVRNM